MRTTSNLNCECDAVHVLLAITLHFHPRQHIPSASAPVTLAADGANGVLAVNDAKANEHQPAQPPHNVPLSAAICITRCSWLLVWCTWRLRIVAQFIATHLYLRPLSAGMIAAYSRALGAQLNSGHISTNSGPAVMCTSFRLSFCVDMAEYAHNLNA